MKHNTAILITLSLSACMPGRPEAPPPMVIATQPAGGPSPVAAADAPIIDDLATATPQSEGRFLGFSVTSLGDESVPGLWLETPLVSAPTSGRIIAESGLTIAVELRPTGGARGSGSRLSLEGFTALGLPATARVTMTVIGDA